MANNDIKKKKGKGVHDGHRERLRKRYFEKGIEALSDHEKLEFLLFFAIPRANTNETAHELIKKFGSLKGVFEADSQLLKSIPGVGGNSVALIKFIGDFYRYMLVAGNNEKKFIGSTVEAGRYIKNFFEGYHHEIFMAFFVDKGSRVLGWEKICEGSIDEIRINPADLMKASLKYKAYGVIIAHNHPGGTAVPSSLDIETTKVLSKALSYLNLKILDHVIIADDNYISFSEMNLL